MAQVKARQFTTPTKHPPHIGHRAGVQILHTLDSLKVLHTKEPFVGGRRACIGKRGVKDHLGHRIYGVISFPTGIVFARVQVVGRARATVALGVVVERQRRVLGRVAGIGLRLIGISGEVAWVARTTVDVGIGRIRMVGIIGRALASHKTGAISEHTCGTCYRCRAPATAHNNGQQTAGVTEHFSHIGHLGRIETAQVKTSQACAVSEHVTHIGYLAGVQVTDAQNGLKILHAFEPTIGGRRAVVSERRVECHPGHIGIGSVSIPTGIIFLCVQVIGPAHAVSAHVVVVERQHFIVPCVAGIGLGTRSSEVARVARAAVDVGIGRIRMAGIIYRTLAAYQTVAIEKHIGGRRRDIRAPATAHIDGSQIAAATKHIIHIDHLKRVETAQVKARQAAAATEHKVHIGHVGRVETAQVKARQTCAATEQAPHFYHLGRVELAHVKTRQSRALIEHITHIGHLVGFQITQACERFQVLHIMKPTKCCRRAGSCEKRVKDHLSHIDFGIVSVPTGIAFPRVQVVGCARASAAIGVIVERQRRVLGRIACVCLGTHSSEIARVAGAAIDVGIGLVNVAGIIGRALAAHQAGGIIEHLCRVHHGLHAPVLASIDSTQIGAAIEHVHHNVHL